MSHRLIYGSKRIDDLFWCLHVEQVQLFLGLYAQLREKNPRAANWYLKSYRRSHPWLSLNVRRDFYSFVFPGRCGSTGRFHQPHLYIHHDILYGCMNCILMMKKRDGVRDWDFWGWHQRRQRERISGNCGASAEIIAAQVQGVPLEEMCDYYGYDANFFRKWLRENSHECKNVLLRECAEALERRDAEIQALEAMHMGIKL